MANIHPTAIVANPRLIPESVVVGPYAIIEDDVILGENIWIDSHVSIKAGTRIGPGTKIFHSAAVGGPPQDLKFAGEKTELIIGANCKIREFATLNRGTIANGRSELGDNCLMMAYSHLAHDCIVGNNVILANTVEMGGHVEIQDYAIIGGGSLVHQFCRIGAHAMIGGGFKVSQDIIPYSLNRGYPIRCMGVNIIGLQRRGFSEHTILNIKKAFYFLLSCKLKTTDAVKKIESEIEPIPEIKLIVDFIKTSERGVTKR